MNPENLGPSGRLVLLHVYDVTNAPSENTNKTVTRLNSFTREINFGGIFHGAVELNGREWSFGFCESGTGIYACHPKRNPMYKYRETVNLGSTSKSNDEVGEMLGSGIGPTLCCAVALSGTIPLFPLHQTMLDGILLSSRALK